MIQILLQVTHTLVGQTNLRNKKNANIANILLAYHRLCTMHILHEGEKGNRHEKVVICIHYILLIILYS